MALTLSPTSKGLLVALCFAIVAEVLAIIYDWPLAVHIVAISVATAIAITAIVVAIMVVAGETDDLQEFLTCPACGTKIPRNPQGSHECYNCGREFSELSGRHPILPDHVNPSPGNRG